MAELSSALLCVRHDRAAPRELLTKPPHTHQSRQKLTPERNPKQASKQYKNKETPQNSKRKIPKLAKKPLCQIVSLYIKFAKFVRNSGVNFKGSKKLIGK